MRSAFFALLLRIWSRIVILMARRKLSTTVYITPEQDAALKLLHARTKVPVAEYIRQGIDLALAKYRDHLPGQVDLELVEQLLPAVASPRAAGRGRRR